jgi:hypothetical protein
VQAQVQAQEPSAGQPVAKGGCRRQQGGQVSVGQWVLRVGVSVVQRKFVP